MVKNIKHSQPKSSENEEKPEDYAGYKEDRDYSNNSSKLHPEPPDRAHNNNQKKSPSGTKGNQEAEYSPNNLNSQDHYDTSPDRKQKPDQKEGQGYKAGH